MQDEIRFMYPPKGKRRHQYCRLERNGKEMWLDLTALRLCTSNESAPVYTLDGEKLVFDTLNGPERFTKKGCTDGR